MFGMLREVYPDIPRQQATILGHRTGLHHHKVAEHISFMKQFPVYEPKAETLTT